MQAKHSPRKGENRGLLLLLCSSEHCKSSLTCKLLRYQISCVITTYPMQSLVLHTISSGRLFHSFMHLVGKEFSLNDFLTCCFSKRNKWPRVLLSLKVKILLISMLSNPLIILKIWIRSNLCLLYNNVCRLRFLSLSSYGKSFSSGTIFIARFCIFSISWMFFLDELLCRNPQLTLSMFYITEETVVYPYGYIWMSF